MSEKKKTPTIRKDQAPSKGKSSNFSDGKVKGYQPITSGRLNSDKPPKGGSGVPPKK